MWPLADTATTLTGVGALTLLGAATSFMGASLRRANNEIKDVRRDNAVCNWRQTVLIEIMHTAGMPVPSWIWRAVPEDVEKLTPEQQRSMAQRMIDPSGEIEPDGK